MDWPLENAGLSDSDLANVFRYEPLQTTVVRLLTTDQEPVLWSNGTSEDWNTWLQEQLPSIQTNPGLVVILARRAGEVDGLLQQILAEDPSFGKSSAEAPMKQPFNEKDRSYSWPASEALAAHLVGKRNRRMKKSSYKSGSREKFHVHTSISRVISRADIPVFSRAEVNMGSDSNVQPAIVYNCRSANTWKDDLALSVTHFPRSRRTFGIFYGCTASIEHQILKRLANAKHNVYHPLILPGIFAELERSRIVDVVESTIDDIEGAIFELDSGIATKDNVSAYEDEESGGTRYVRRTVWLNTTFLRSRLQIWKTQLQKMVEHVDELSAMEPFSSSEVSTPDDCHESKAMYDIEIQTQLRKTGWLIKDRLRTLLEEYDEKIEECSMRIAGMAIATQWAQGDTNVDIATSTSQDSSQMRSISLVTMVFLPGTFFATLFSMTFFNWSPSGEDGSTIVSSYIWLYFVLTSLFTIITLGAWWYFLGNRKRRTRPGEKKKRFGLF